MSKHRADVWRPSLQEPHTGTKEEAFKGTAWRAPPQRRWKGWQAVMAVMDGQKGTVCTRERQGSRRPMTDDTG